MRKSVYLVAVLAILTVCLQYEVLVYRSLLPILVWSNQTLYINVVANRNGWRACKLFNICTLHSRPPSKPVWHGAMAFRG